MRSPPPTRSGPTAPRAGVDLGWLFLLPGIVLIASAVLIAAEDDLYQARFQRDQAIAIEGRHAQRVERYQAYLEAVRRRDPTVVRSLVAGQLNSAPTDMIEERLAGLPVYDSNEVFASLEPPEAVPAQRERTNSVLARWATDDSSRVWLLASGALCVFVGLLPPISPRRPALLAADASAQEEAEQDDGPLTEDAEFEADDEADEEDDEEHDEKDDEEDEEADATDPESSNDPESSSQDDDEGQDDDSDDLEDDQDDELEATPEDADNLDNDNLEDDQDPESDADEPAPATRPSTRGAGQR